MEKKTHCIRGHEWTPENIYVDLKTGGRRCRTCHRNAERGKHSRRRYGVTDRSALLASQGNVCAICGIAGLTWCESFTKSWHIDHDHSKPTGTHRGVLCAPCNTALGRLEKYLPQVNSYLAKYADEQRAI